MYQNITVSGRQNWLLVSISMLVFRSVNLHIKNLCLNFSFIPLTPVSVTVANFNHCCLWVQGTTSHKIHAVESHCWFLLPPFSQTGNGKLPGSPLSLLFCLFSLKDESGLNHWTFTEIMNACMKTSAFGSTLLRLEPSSYSVWITS